MALFTVEVMKERGNYNWVNTWHLNAADLGGAVDNALHIRTFERALLDDEASIVNLKVSAWPNPTGQQFTNIPSNVAGARNLTQVAPAELCVFCVLPTTMGHPGKKWFRFSIEESEYEASGSGAVISTGAPILTAISVASSALAAALAQDGGVLMVGATPGTARAATNTVVSDGIGFRDADVGWYNKNA